MWFFGKRRGAEIIVKTTALHGKATPRDILGQLYELLTILDSKAAGLLTVDALFIAILGTLLGSPETMKTLIGRAVAPLIIEFQLGFTVISAFLCMLVVRVSWRFFFWVPNAPSKASDFDAEIARLANVIDDRTHFYWLAWLLALCAFVATLAWWSWFWMVVAAIALVIFLWGRG